MKILKIVVSCILAMVLLVSLYFVFDSAGVFFKEVGSGIADYNVVSEDELTNKLPVQGTVYTVYDCIAVKYDADSGEDEAFFYLIEFDKDENLYMILQAPADTQLNDDISALCDAYILADNDSLLQKGVKTDGILVKTDSGIEDEFNSWKNNRSLLGEDTSNYNLVSYTYDCTYPVGFFHGIFIISTIVTVIFIAALAVLLIAIKKDRNSTVPVGGNYLPQQNMGQPNVGQPNNSFGVQNQYNQFPNMYNQNNYNPQNFPQAVNTNPNDLTFVPSSEAAPSVQNYNPAPTFYADEQKVSLDKTKYDTINEQNQ